MKHLFLLFILCTFLSCSKDEFSNIEGSFLTINDDTRELINNGNDSDLSIEKYAYTLMKNTVFNLTEDVMRIGVTVYDPNNSLIANFGNYNIDGDYLSVSFVFPVNFSEGDYSTLNQIQVPIDNQSFGDFWIQQEVSSTANSNQTVTVNDKGNMYELIFSDITFDNGAVISGRILANK